MSGAVAPAEPGLELEPQHQTELGWGGATCSMGRGQKRVRGDAEEAMGRLGAQYSEYKAMAGEAAGVPLKEPAGSWEGAGSGVEDEEGKGAVTDADTGAREGEGERSPSTPWLGKQHQQQQQAEEQGDKGDVHQRRAKEEQHLQMCSLTMGGGASSALTGSPASPDHTPADPLRLDSTLAAGPHLGMGMGGPVGVPMGCHHPLAGLGMSVGGGLGLAGMGLGSLASMASFPSMGRIQSEDQLFLFRPRSLLQLEQQLLEHQADLEAQEEQQESNEGAVSPAGPGHAPGGGAGAGKGSHGIGAESHTPGAPSAALSGGGAGQAQDLKGGGESWLSRGASRTTSDAGGVVLSGGGVTSLSAATQPYGSSHSHSQGSPEGAPPSSAGPAIVVKRESFFADSSEAGAGDSLPFSAPSVSPHGPAPPHPSLPSAAGSTAASPELQTVKGKVASYAASAAAGAAGSAGVAGGGVPGAPRRDRGLVAALGLARGDCGRTPVAKAACSASSSLSRGPGASTGPFINTARPSAGGLPSRGSNGAVSKAGAGVAGGVVVGGGSIAVKKVEEQGGETGYRFMAGCGEGEGEAGGGRGGGGEGGREVESEEDRRQKRMLSNRESARRSRQRKQRRVEDMKGQASQLAAQNADMAFQCEKASKSLAQMNRENRVLRSHAADLSRRLQRLNYMAAVHSHPGSHPHSHPHPHPPPHLAAAAASHHPYPWPGAGPHAPDMTGMGLMGVVPAPQSSHYVPPSALGASAGFSGDPFAGMGYMSMDYGSGKSLYGLECGGGKSLYGLEHGGGKSLYGLEHGDGKSLYGAGSPYASLDVPGMPMDPGVGLGAGGSSGLESDGAEEGARAMEWATGGALGAGQYGGTGYWSASDDAKMPGVAGASSKGAAKSRALPLFPGHVDLH